MRIAYPSSAAHRPALRIKDAAQACRPPVVAVRGEYKALRTYIGEERPASAIHGVARWRAGDLIVQVREESGRERIPR